MQLDRLTRFSDLKANMQGFRSDNASAISSNHLTHVQKLVPVTFCTLVNILPCAYGKRGYFFGT